MNKKSYGVILYCIAILFISLNNYALSQMSQYAFSIGHALFWRNITSTALVIAVVTLYRFNMGEKSQILTLPKRLLFIQTLRGIVLFLGFYLWVYHLNTVSFYFMISAIQLLPIFSVIMGVVFFRETVHQSISIVLLFCLLGALLIISPWDTDAVFYSIPLTTLISIFFNILFYSTYSVTQRIISQESAFNTPDQLIVFILLCLLQAFFSQIPFNGPMILCSGPLRCSAHSHQPYFMPSLPVLMSTQKSLIWHLLTLLD